MDYKEWFDELCETHEREMKQAELRGYARGYQQGLESDVVPKPCNGPLYAGWSPANYLCKVVEEIGEVGEAFDAYDRDPGDMEKWGHLMEECCDGIVALTGLMDCLGCDEGARQFFMRGVNKSNATRDNGKRFKE